MKYSLCFLTLRPTKILLDFIITLKKDNYDISIVIDDNEYDTSNIHKDINVIQIDDLKCMKNSYKYANSLWWRNFHDKNKCFAWDKALYYFANRNHSYDHLWFIEDDVFVPDKDSIWNIDKKYPASDLLTTSSDYIINQDGALSTWPHWYEAKNNNLKLPWAKSMVCASRMSNELLSHIKDYVTINKKLLYIEFFFHTLALHNQLKVDNPEELSSIYWKKKWLFKDINKAYLYHPFKDHDLQQKYRERLQENWSIILSTKIEK